LVDLHRRSLSVIVKLHKKIGENIMNSLGDKKLFINLSDEAHMIQQDPTEQFALDVLMGLTSSPKSLPSKYFYDDEGSRLFAKITDTKDYYPTQCEAEILKNHSQDFLSFIPNREPINFVELGAGDGRKTQIFLDNLNGINQNISYVPIDISQAAVEGITQQFRSQFPKLQIEGIVGEYFQALKWMATRQKSRNFVLFLGSNIGNFNHSQAEVFLRTMWNALNDGDFLLFGCDLKKNIDVMLRAYNDQEGYTKLFNINLLKRMNNELGANFQIKDFDHFGTYNIKLGAMESFIMSLKRQEVFVKHLGKTFCFEPYEPIHVEFSFKYLPEQINRLAKDTGFLPVAQYMDTKNYFCDSLVRVAKAS
jgi:L-histidine Nalpha-methyltransferase